MAKRSDFVRVERDYYPTPLAAAQPLVPFLPEKFSFCEPCAGDGRLVSHIETLCPSSKCVLSTDIVPQSSTVGIMDALSITPAMMKAHGVDLIITNPPWDRTKKSGFLLHKLIETFTIACDTWLLFDADWAHTLQAQPFLSRFCVDIVSVGRVKWIEDSKMTGKDNCAWYHFSTDARNSSKSPRFWGRGIQP